MDNTDLIENIISNKNIEEPNEEELETFKIWVQDWFKYDLNTQNGRLKTNIKTVHKPVNIKEIKDIINDNKNLTGEELLNKIFNKENRPVVEKKTIKRIIPKVSMKISI